MSSMAVEGFEHDTSSNKPEYHVKLAVLLKSQVTRRGAYRNIYGSNISHMQKCNTYIIPI